MQSAEYFIDQNPAFFDQFTMIIATSLHENYALKLASICQSRNTPLFLTKCIGFAGMFRIQAGEHTSKQFFLWKYPKF
jgi:amyloid beta precursor protein binding protein 1